MKPCHTLSRLLRRVLPGLRARSVELVGDRELSAELDSDIVRRVRLRVVADGASLRLSLAGARHDARWELRQGRELFWLEDRRSGERSERTTPAVPAAERALRQLVAPQETGGDRLADAAAVQDLAEQLLARSPRRLTIGRRALRHASRLAARDADGVESLGLVGRLPSGGAIHELDDPGFGHSEVWAFRAGVKPVVFLTVEPDAVEKTSDLFPGAHAERRERRVARDANDAWVDDRSSGTPMVELYISRDAALARRAAALQADDDPTARLEAMGELLGYPRCCIDAFRLQRDRSDNTGNRYAAASRTESAGPWPWQLNDSFCMVVPFFPCRYDCADALVFAEAVLDQFAGEHPGRAERLRDALAQPVLYFAEGRLAVLSGQADRRACRYSAVACPPRASPSFLPLARTLSLGSKLDLDDDRLVVRRAGGETLSLARTDPPLGVLLPFG